MAGVKRGKGKPKWVEGTDFPMYSGRKWGELEDVWPASMRIADDAYKIVCLMTPAWQLTKEFMKATLGDTIDMRAMFIMCWMQRVEDAKENVGFRAWPVMKGMNIGGALWYARKAKIIKLGLVERIPLPRVHLYRLAPTGKMMVKHFVDSLNEANMKLDEWMSSASKKSDHMHTLALRKYFDISEDPLSEPPSESTPYSHDD